MIPIETLEELKEIQLGILLSFHQFCQDNTIKYSLAAGTLIGAIRHKGFIPWDDDIDVYLMRDDYEKLVSLFPNVYQGRFSLITKERDNNWHRPYGKLCDNRTEEVEDARNRYNGIGIGIDVFPIDEVPDEANGWITYERRRRLLRNMMTMKSMKYTKTRPFYKNAFMFFCRLVLSPISFSLLSNWIDKYAQRNNNKGYEHVYENCLGLYNSEHPWRKDSFEDVIDYSFEGHALKIMRGYDDYLSTVYGDYMKLPPENKRVSTHTITAYWKEEV